MSRPARRNDFSMTSSEAVASGEDGRAQTLALLLTLVSVVVVVMAARLEPRRLR